MAKRRPDARRIKLHRSYSVEEAARILAVHKNTIAKWLKNGLGAIDDRRPILIQGRVLRSYLEERHRTRRRRCGRGELYCLRCRAPRRPAENRAIYTPLLRSGGNLQGRCWECSSIVCRRVSLTQLSELKEILSITIRQASSRINDRTTPCLDC
jgi:excisionase family DNA binding protein